MAIKWTPEKRRAFALKMKRARLAKRRKNPAKLERCVKKVRRKRGVKNAYAICNASIRRRRRNAHRKSGMGYVILAIPKKGGSRLYYDGRNFSSRHTKRLFPSQQGAASVARSLVQHYPVLRTYNVYVHRMTVS